MHKYFIYAILGVTGFGTFALAQFVDELLSVDLAPNPQSGYVLSTDGTNNTWIVNTGGGGGSDTNWTYDTTNNVLYSDGSSTTPTTTVRSLTFTASSTSENSVLPRFTSTQATITNATSTTGWFSSILRAASAVFSSSILGFSSSTAHTVSGNTYLGSLTGVLKGTSGLVSTAANGTDYTLIAGTTCGGTDKVSAISASGVVTCAADQNTDKISTSTALADTYVTYATGVNTIATMFNTPYDAFRWVSDGTYRTALVGTSSASNAKLEINNTDTTSTRGMLRIISESASGADYDIRIDSPDADIEFCGSGAASPDCLFEFNQVKANGQLYISPRNGADSSFADPLMTWHRDSSSGAGSMGIGTRFDTPEAKLEIAASSTDTNILALTSAQGATVGDRAVWKRITGFMGLGEAIPSTMLHIATTSGSATHNFITLENTGAFAEGGAGMLFQNTAGSIDMARLYARPGSSYTDASFRIQVADSGKVLRDRFVIDVNGMASTTALRTASSTIDNATTTNLAVSTQFNFLGTVITNVATWFDTVLESMSNVVAAAASVWDFGGAASLEIPNGASPTVDATGEIAYDTTSGQLKVYSGSIATVIGNGTTTASFTYSTSTAWTGTTTMALGAAPWAETWQSVRCFTGAGNVNVDFGDGTNWTNATTTGANNPAPRHFFTTNNTFTAGEQRFVRMGTPATSPTYVSCTVYRSITGD